MHVKLTRTGYAAGRVGIDGREAPEAYPFGVGLAITTTHRTCQNRQIEVQALVGTRKGLFMLRSDDERRRWRTEGPLLGGWGIFHAIGDPRDGTIYAAANHAVYGPTVQRSTDGGATWKRSQQIGLPEKSGMILEATWPIEPGPPEAPRTLPRRM